MKRHLFYLLSTLILLAGCPENPDGDTADNSIPPSFHSTMISNTTIAPVTAMFRYDAPDEDWSFYREFEDLAEGDCYDIAVAPNATQRFLAFSQRDSNGQWHIFVRTSLGSEIWGSPENDSRSEVIEGPEFGCITPYINHLKDNLYGIVWVVDGTLYSAVFAPGNTTGFEITLGDEEDGFFEGVSVRNISMVYYDDSLRVVWMTPDRDRVMQLRGQISASELVLFPGATFTALDSSSHSDVIAREDGLYIAAWESDEVKLYHTGGAGTDWAEVASCETPWRISHSLLYVDREDHVRVMLTGASITNQRTLSFTDCSLEVLQVPVGNRGRITYSPGT